MENRREVVAVVAAVVLATAILMASRSSPAALAATVAFVCGMAAWITVVDRKDFLIPDGPTLAIGIVGAATRFVGRDQADTSASVELILVVFDALLWGGCILAVREIYFRRRGMDGVGLGDVKLAAACGILNGAAGFAWSLLVASVGALLAVWAANSLSRRAPADRVAFGAFLAPVCCGVWIIQTAGWV